MEEAGKHHRKLVIWAEYESVAYKRLVLPGVRQFFFPYFDHVVLYSSHLITFSDTLMVCFVIPLLIGAVRL